MALIFVHFCSCYQVVSFFRFLLFFILKGPFPRLGAWMMRPISRRPLILPMTFSGTHLGWIVAVAREDMVGQVHEKNNVGVCWMCAFCRNKCYIYLMRVFIFWIVNTEVLQAFFLPPLLISTCQISLTFITTGINRCSCLKGYIKHLCYFMQMRGWLT